MVERLCPRAEMSPWSRVRQEGESQLLRLTIIVRLFLRLPVSECFQLLFYHSILDALLRLF